MKHIASGVVKHRKMIILIALFLLIPAVIGILNTRINYDVLVYLPDNIQTVQGQNILKKDFGTGGISMPAPRLRAVFRAANYVSCGPDIGPADLI